MVRMGYVVEEPLDNKVLSNIVLPIDHKGGDVDTRKSIVDIPVGESGIPEVHVGQKMARNNRTKRQPYVAMGTVGSAKR